MFTYVTPEHPCLTFIRKHGTEACPDMPGGEFGLPAGAVLCMLRDERKNQITGCSMCVEIFDELGLHEVPYVSPDSVSSCFTYGFYYVPKLLMIPLFPDLKF